MQNYDLLIERIAKMASLDKAEIEKRVEAKKAKLSGLISKEGAAQIIAAELGINFENQDLKISELVAGMRRVNPMKPTSARTAGDPRSAAASATEVGNKRSAVTRTRPKPPARPAPAGPATILSLVVVLMTRSIPVTAATW